MVERTYNIVLDTNVLIAAARSPKGASFRLIELLGEKRFEIHISVALVLEYEEVLRREATPEMWADRDVDIFLDYLVAVAHWHKTPFNWRPMLRDPDDDFLLEIAVAAGVDCIVTHNVKDFSEAVSFGIEVLKPREFLRRVEDQL